jgi:chromosome segregation ATPase
MAIIEKVSSGTLFVKFTAIGLVALFASIIFLKYTNIAGAYTAIGLGAFIFSINLFSVLGYTRAVLLNPDVLAESDAPDLAYYLGFCLTVGALSATFITDTIISQFVSVNASQGAAAAAQSDLIKGSLVQFGVGLTATLIGLCAKVYLASKQSEDTLELEEFYRRFRMEIQSFQYEMQGVTTSYTQTLNNSMNHIKNAMDEVRDSFIELSEVAKNANMIISSKLSDEEIGQPISEFSESVKSFNKSAKGLANSGKDSMGAFKEISSSLSEVGRSLTEVDESAKNLIANTTQLSVSTQDLFDANQAVGKVQRDLANEVSGLASNLKTANTNTNSFSDSISNLSNDLVKSSQDITSFSSGFNTLANSFSTMSGQVANFDSALQKSSEDLNLNGNAGKAFSSEVQNLQAGISKLTSELGSLESKLKHLNQIN